MKALFLLLISLSSQAQDYTLILPTPNPYTPQMTITPNGIYHTFSTGNASTTVGPNGIVTVIQTGKSRVILDPQPVIVVEKPK
jgi:hypothetical protein